MKKKNERYLLKQFSHLKGLANNFKLEMQIH